MPHFWLKEEEAKKELYRLHGPDYKAAEEVEIMRAHLQNQSQSLNQGGGTYHMYLLLPPLLVVVHQCLNE